MTTWHTAVAWKRGPLGGLHAQWRDEEIPGASCCSESSALSGPDEGYSAGACRACVALALSLASQTDATCSAEPRPVEAAAKPLDWRAMRVESARRVALLRDEEVRTGRPVTAKVASALWGTSLAAAHMALRALRKRGAVSRVGYGLFRVAVAAPEVTP